MRLLVALLAAAAALSLAVTLALAAPGALSPTRAASAAEYCPPGELQSRQAAVDSLTTRVQNTAAANARFRANQLKARKKYLAALKKNKKLTPAKRTALYKAYVRKQDAAYKRRVQTLNALRTQLRQAQAQLDRCD